MTIHNSTIIPRRINIVLLCLIFSLFYLPLIATGQIVINEFSAINTGALIDFEGAMPDWIEIHNASPSAYQLEGHFISDDFKDPYKWTFPNMLIPSGGYIIVFASGKNTFGDYHHTNFKLSSNGEEIIFSDKNGITLDSIDYGGMEANFSFGKITDGGTNWTCFSQPTPNMSNSLSEGLEGCYIGAPQFNLEGGFYENNIEVEINPIAAGHTIHYTSDGSIPTIEDAIYNTAITVGQNMVIRAINYNPSTGYFSLPETHTYFINEDFSHLPVVSISTDSCHLWSEEKGIYITGPNADTIAPYYGANYWMNWEVPIHLEFFETNKTLAFEGLYDMKIHGGTSARTKAMKPLRILAKKKYKQSFIEHQVFKDKDAHKFKRLVFRNSGSDFNQTMFRDGKVHHLALQAGLNLDVSAYRPCIIFLNGTYWGLHNIREKMDEYYLLSNYGIDIDNVDFLEENNDIVVGNFDLFNEHEAYILQNDLSITSQFEIAAQWFDLENLTDYFITQTFHNNYDWPNNNLKFWRERKSGAKWRYLMFDLDYGTNAVHPNEVNTELLFFTLDYYKEINRHVKILLRFLENDNFRRYFINRYADLLNTSFSTADQLEHLDSVATHIAPFIPRHFNKWNSPVSDWQDHIEDYLKPFFEGRPDVIFEDLRNYFGFTSTIDVQFKVYPENAGNIQVNTIPKDALTFPWEGRYFQNLALDITAHADAGFVFLNWTNHKGEIISNQEITTKAFGNNETITANFRAIDAPPAFVIIPNPVQNHFTIALSLDQESTIKWSIFDALGKRIIEQESGDYAVGYQHISIHDLDIPSGVYFLEINTKNQQQTQRFIVQ